VVCKHSGLDLPLDFRLNLGAARVVGIGSVGPPRCQGQVCRFSGAMVVWPAVGTFGVGQVRKWVKG
jgi:hypothetical protein